MKFRFTIGRKIGAGFGLLIILTIFTFILTNKTLNNSKKINDEITNVYKPSVDALQELKTLTFRSKLLIYNWVHTPTATQSSPDKQKLLVLTHQQFPDVKKKIINLSKNWDAKEQIEVQELFKDYKELFKEQAYVENLLPNFESYNDPEASFLAANAVNKGGDIYKSINKVILQLNTLINEQKYKSGKITGEMISSFSLLQALVRYLGIGLVIGGILIAIYTTRSIVSPIQKLRKMLLSMGKGILPDHSIKKCGDEIGDMVIAMDRLIIGLKSTQEFANEVGSGNFESHYKPLSEQDTLGQALLKMRNDLSVNEKELEDKVKQRTAEVVKQKEEIEIQSKRINELYIQTTDSIRYAKRLQNAILPPEKTVEKLLKDAFILFKPKDIVSGDFYWVTENKHGTYFSAIDCTGHGVPGAFMSIIGYNLLGQSLAQAKNGSPGEVLNLLNQGITNALHQKDENATRDGMDMAMCRINRKEMYVEFAGAHNPLYIVRNNQLQETKADRFPIGSYIEGEKKSFTNHKIGIQEGDMIYVFSDGYPDQFGGPNGKKLMYKQFQKMLCESASKSTQEQKEILDNFIESWMKEESQIDDILIMGIRV